MIRSFRNVATEDVFYGRRTKAARRLCPSELWQIAVRKLEYLDSVTSLPDLRRPPNNRLERLRDDREGAVEHSDQQAVPDLFRVDRGGPGPR